MFAYEELTNEVLPYVMEHGTKLFRLQVLALLAQTCIQLSNVKGHEESKEDCLNEYKRGCLSKA